MKLRKFISSTYPRRCGGDTVDAELIVEQVETLSLALLVGEERMSLQEAAEAGFVVIEVTPQERRDLGDSALPLGMAYFIAFYQELNRGGDQKIANELFCPVEGVETLRDFLAPRQHPAPFSGEPNHFAEDVDQMAAIIQADPLKLANFVNLTRILDLWRAHPPAPGSGFLAHLYYPDGSGEWVEGRNGEGN